MTTQTSRRLINIVTALSMTGIVVLTVYWWQLGIFQNQTLLHEYLAQRQVAGPLLFILVQIIQVVIPIIPGGVSTAVGVLLFGPLAGFIYNYVGIAIGSFISFFLARHYGKDFILHLIPEKTYRKYIDKTKNQRYFDRFFALAIFLPMAPDDILVMLAGLTKMTWTKFALIIILLKPFTIAAYSYVLLYGSQWLLRLF
ncbi:TVP38/TMEM64 family protein [Lapidilactobacillus achengensis]|uniref:TVP38/TMEM64 family membrane protein n=1 Tax=Lapidilactobacillus achengensis TaxID=2486000 RepID=A0ABW1USA7_9LACO|nr:VTT domain-containing protein [Lapidilactobacillus achengensis]